MRIQLFKYTESGHFTFLNINTITNYYVFIYNTLSKIETLLCILVQFQPHKE